MTEPAGGHYDAAVLGAGVSGLVSASILVEHGCRRVLVVDGYPRVGGNHIDRSIGDYTFDVGSFIFQDDSPLLAHLPEILPRYVPIDPSWGKLNPQGVITTYPFSIKDDFLAAGWVECLRMALSAAYARVFHRRMGTARDFARFWIGARLLRRSGLENYMERLCGLPADRIDLGFARKRMLWISEHASVARALRLLLRARSPQQEIAPPTNRQLARPRAGFVHLYQPAVDRLTKDGVAFAFGERPTRVERTDDGFRIRIGDRTVTADRVVSTIPVDHALDICGSPPRDPLPTVTLVSLFYSFRGDRGFAQPVLYNFAHAGAWKRLTVYSDFYGRATGREFFGVEVPTSCADPAASELSADFERHVIGNGLFNGDLRLEGHHVLQNAYPIYTDRAEERAAAGIAELRAFGVESFGRQGGFTYQPTARVSTMEAEAALKHVSESAT